MCFFYLKTYVNKIHFDLPWWHLPFSYLFSKMAAPFCRFHNPYFINVDIFHFIDCTDITVPYWNSGNTAFYLISQFNDKKDKAMFQGSMWSPLTYMFASVYLCTCVPGYLLFNLYHCMWFTPLLLPSLQCTALLRKELVTLPCLEYIVETWKQLIQLSIIFKE